MLAELPSWIQSKRDLWKRHAGVVHSMIDENMFHSGRLLVASIHGQVVTIKRYWKIWQCPVVEILLSNMITISQVLVVVPSRLCDESLASSWKELKSNTGG